MMKHMQGSCKRTKSGSSEDKLRTRIVAEEITHFKKLIEGHRRLLEAIGRL